MPVSTALSEWVCVCVHVLLRIETPGAACSPSRIMSAQSSKAHCSCEGEASGMAVHPLSCQQQKVQEFITEPKTWPKLAEGNVPLVGLPNYSLWPWAKTSELILRTLGWNLGHALDYSSNIYACLFVVTATHVKWKWEGGNNLLLTVPAHFTFSRVYLHIFKTWN